ncbi:MAG TPA: type II toxin-antitoxin system VapC family toxin [Pirellulales bacterium]
MTILVADASVGVKWFVPEVYSDEAAKCRDPGHELHAPALFDVEFASVLWKKVRRGELKREEADDILSQLPSLPIRRYSDAPLLVAAFDLAVRTNRTVYDSLYLALAEQLAGRVVTADERWVNSLAATQWASRLVFVGKIA